MKRFFGNCDRIFRDIRHFGKINLKGPLTVILNFSGKVVPSDGSKYAIQPIMRMSRPPFELRNQDDGLNFHQIYGSRSSLLLLPRASSRSSGDGGRMAGTNSHGS